MEIALPETVQCFRKKLIQVSIKTTSSGATTYAKQLRIGSSFILSQNRVLSIKFAIASPP
jgi:hypothetical protein